MSRADEPVTRGELAALLDKQIVELQNLPADHIMKVVVNLHIVVLHAVAKGLRE